MAEELAQATLRDTIAEQFDNLETQTTDASTTPAPAADAVETPALQGAEQGAGDDKPGRTAGRARDEQGRLLPGKAERPTEVPTQVPAVATPGAVASPPAVTPVAEPPIKAPNSWKPELHGEFAKAPPAVQKYIHEREEQMSRGIAPLRQQIEQAKPVMDALAPHMPLLQQHGIDPGQQVGRYMQIHKTLAMGSPQEKLGLLAQVARDYQIPLEQLFVRGNDGQVYLNNQLPAYTPPAPPQPDMNAVIETKLIEREAQQAARQFVEAKDDAGNPKHPHFETVKETMSQLLAAGIANDLPSAYDAALRLPQHSQLYEQQQQQRSAAEEAKKASELAARAGIARRSAVSVKSGTPASNGSAQAPKGIRGALEAAWDSAMPGRV